VDTCISRRVRADPAAIFRLAAAVEDWPRILPHYQRVRVLDRHADGRRTVAMAATRNVVAGLGIPVRWTAVQSVDERAHRIEFQHIRGVTRGMYVVWTMEPVEPLQPGRAGQGGADSALLVRIRHVFEPRWPVPETLVRLIVGEYFVNGVARRTLQRIGELAEVQSPRYARAGQQP
jgi:ribosome-associated toxin RatA of RatAB toxin-antitoxin module